MKLTYFQCEQQIERTLAPIYLISGEEALLKNDVFHWLRKASLKENFIERIRFLHEKGSQEEALYNLLYARSLLADKRLLELDFRNNLPNKAIANLLIQYAENPLPENILVLNFDKLESSVLKAKWYQCLEKAGVAITLWPMDRQHLPAWLIQRAKKYKITLSKEIADAIAFEVEGNLVAAANAIEKLYLLREQSLTVEFVKSFLQDQARFSIFDFSQQLILGDPEISLRMLKSLKEEGVEPAIILWGITRELRTLAEMAEEIASGHSYEKIWQQHKIFSKRQTGIRRFLNRFKENDCFRLLKDAAQIDQIIKGVGKGDPWNSLQLFCLRLI